MGNIGVKKGKVKAKERKQKRKLYRYGPLFY